MLQECASCTRDATCCPECGCCSICCNCEEEEADGTFDSDELGVDPEEDG